MTREPRVTREPFQPGTALEPTPTRVPPFATWWPWIEIRALLLATALIPLGWAGQPGPKQAPAVRPGRLHGNEGEAQVLREMKARLALAVERGDCEACRREGENLARYGQVPAGLELIRGDQRKLQQRIDFMRQLFQACQSFRTLKNQESVRQAYRLIGVVRGKFIEDAFTDLAFTFVPASKAVEVYKGVVALLGNPAVGQSGLVQDTVEVRDSAKALVALDKVVKDYSTQIAGLRPAIHELERIRASLLACEKAYLQAGGGEPPKGLEPASSGAPVLRTELCNLSALGPATQLADSGGFIPRAPARASVLDVDPLYDYPLRLEWKGLSFSYRNDRVRKSNGHRSTLQGRVDAAGNLLDIEATTTMTDPANITERRLSATGGRLRPRLVKQPTTGHEAGIVVVEYTLTPADGWSFHYEEVTRNSDGKTYRYASAGMKGWKVGLSFLKPDPASLRDIQALSR